MNLFFRFVSISIILFTISCCSIFKPSAVISENDIEVISNEEAIFEGDLKNFQNIVSTTLEQYTAFDSSNLVFIELIINEKGKIIDFNLKNTNPKTTEKSIKKELVRSLSQFSFIPGKFNGKPIKSRMLVPISLH